MFHLSRSPSGSTLGKWWRGWSGRGCLDIAFSGTRSISPVAQKRLVKRAGSTSRSSPTGNQAQLLFYSPASEAAWNTGKCCFCCCRCLQSAENADPQFHLEYRGPVTMKGKKEPMKVWFLSRKPTVEPATVKAWNITNAAKEQRTWGKVAMVCPPVCCF